MYLLNQSLFRGKQPGKMPWKLHYQSVVSDVGWLHLRIWYQIYHNNESTPPNYRRQEPSGVAIEAILVLFAAFVVGATHALVNLNQDNR
jgi:hypothetical protein